MIRKKKRTKGSRKTEEASAPEVHVAYCSACDREVRVRAPAGFRDRERLDAHDIARLVCLDHEDACTGAFCPFSEENEIEPGG